MNTKSNRQDIFFLAFVFKSNTVENMETIKQYKVAEWLEVNPGTLANIFCENRRPSRHEAKRLAEKTGVPFEDWMLSDGNILRHKVFMAYSIAKQQARGKQ